MPRLRKTLLLVIAAALIYIIGNAAGGPPAEKKPARSKPKKGDAQAKSGGDKEKKKSPRLKTVAELKSFKQEAEQKHQATAGEAKLWGKPAISAFIKPKGKVLYQDNFAKLDNWHHEGVGELMQPEPNLVQLSCIGSRQGRAGCMAFCRTDFPDNIYIEYDMRALTSHGLLITFIAASGRQGEDIITGLPPREGIFADYIYNPGLRCYHVSVSRYNDKGEHTGFSNWRRNPGLFLMEQNQDPCKIPNRWYHVAIVKKGKLLQMAVDGRLIGGFVDRGEIPEPLPAGGKVGFRVIGADVRVQIKNFKVTALE